MHTHTWREKIQFKELQKWQENKSGTNTGRTEGQTPSVLLVLTIPALSASFAGVL